MLNKIFEWIAVPFFKKIIDKLFEGKAIKTTMFKIPFLKNKYDKHNTHILFIDDEKFPIIDNLKKAGWSVERKTDVKNIDDDVIKRSQIIFVDYKGVGCNFSDNEEGVGLIKALKNNYHNSKRIILYSGYDKFSLDIDFKAADNYLSKNSETYEFIKMIEMEMSKIK